METPSRSPAYVSHDLRPAQARSAAADTDECRLTSVRFLLDMLAEGPGSPDEACDRSADSGLSAVCLATGSAIPSMTVCAGSVASSSQNGHAGTE